MHRSNLTLIEDRAAQEYNPWKQYLHFQNIENKRPVCHAFALVYDIFF